MLEQNLRDDAFARVHHLERLFEAPGRKAVRHERLEVDEPAVEQTDNLTPRRRRVGEAAYDVEVAEDEPVHRQLEHLAFTGDAEQDNAPAWAHETGRELDGIDSAGGLEHEIESAADETPGLGDSVLLGHMDRGVGAWYLDEAELLASPAVRSSYTRRVQTRKRDR